jgi:hypothetical protein
MSAYANREGREHMRYRNAAPFWKERGVEK